MQEDRITLEGIVKSIIYKNEDNGYVIFEAEVNGEGITMVGTVPFLFEGESIIACGLWCEHKTYGRQFSIESFEKGMPVSESAICNYLAGGAIKGVGAVTAGRIVELFGSKTLEVIENDPSQLTRVKGISPQKAQSISNAFKEQFGIRSVLLFFQQYDISLGSCLKIWKHWGAASVDIISCNPYLLCEYIEGIGFAKADGIAVKMGFDELSPYRICAALRYILIQNSFNGHTFLPRNQLVSITAKLIGCEEADVEAQVENQISEEHFINRSIGNKDAIYLSRYYNAEFYCVKKILKMLLLSGVIDFDRSEIKKIEKSLKISYNEKQFEAIACSADRGIMVLTGGPGTGKTTALGGIIALYERLGLKYALAAPTGRAAKRISELTGKEAKTIHRLLEMQYTDDGYPKFMKNEESQFEYDAIICDEASMIDVLLMEALMKALPEKCRLVLVGDADQLPPVGPGNCFGDIIHSGLVPFIALDHIFRQAADSQIIINAHRILQGEPFVFSGEKRDMFFINCKSAGQCMDMVVDLCVRRLKNAYGWDVCSDIQVLTPSKLGICGTVNINKRIKEIINPQADGKAEMEHMSRVFRCGDKVMQTKNNYDIDYITDNNEVGVGIYNGDIGIIKSIDNAREQMLIQFDDRCTNYPFKNLEELEFAYAVTVHKSQGSEFKCVILTLLDTPSNLLYRNLLYTAITRAKEMLIVIGSPEKIDKMIENKNKIKRFSGLKYLLCETMLEM